MSNGILIVISAPSGGGKSTLAREIFKEFPSLKYSVSVTTRSPRSGEKEGQDYCYISEKEFIKKRDSGELVEYAEVHGYWYGTPKGFIDQNLKAGLDVLLDIDVQGGRQIKKIYPEAVMVFITPPSFSVLEARLRQRQQDDESTIRKRLEGAAKEIGEAKHYDYLIVNEEIAQSAESLKAIVRSERLKMRRNQSRLKHFFNS